MGRTLICTYAYLFMKGKKKERETGIERKEHTSELGKSVCVCACAHVRKRYTHRKREIFIDIWRIKAMAKTTLFQYKKHPRTNLSFIQFIQCIVVKHRHACAYTHTRRKKPENTSPMPATILLGTANHWVLDAKRFDRFGSHWIRPRQTSRFAQQ